MSVPLAFSGLVDLAACELGGRVLFANDEFFAPAENLLRAGRASFDEQRYTERGKWMDGWETRRRRGPGHDECLIELGAPGRVLGFDIDTQHFIGNHPPYAAVEGVRAPRGTPLETLASLPFFPLLEQSLLAPGAQNLFVALPGDNVSHVRLRIFPDGGVARFRVYGRVEPTWEAPEHDPRARREVAPELFDLAALKNGGLALACSDARFAPMSQLLMPGRPAHTGQGWESRRSRAPEHSHDWLIVKLGVRGTLRVVEIDTSLFIGNAPDRAALEGIDAPNAALTDLVYGSAWLELVPETKLEPNSRHFVANESKPEAPVSHVRLKVFPDGGISRLRIWGKRHG
jgi:allantoicase